MTLPPSCSLLVSPLWAGPGPFVHSMCTAQAELVQLEGQVEVDGCQHPPADGG